MKYFYYGTDEHIYVTDEEVADVELQHEDTGETDILIGSVSTGADLMRVLCSIKDIGFSIDHIQDLVNTYYPDVNITIPPRDDMPKRLWREVESDEIPILCSLFNVCEQYDRDCIMDTTVVDCTGCARNFEYELYQANSEDILTLNLD